MTQEETQAMLDAMENEQSKGKSSFWTAKTGENPVRFLPPLKPNEEKLPYFHHKVHWIDGVPYECLNQTFVDENGKLHEAEECPACKMSKKLFKMGEKGSEERELAYNLMAKDRYIFRIVDRKADNPTQPEFFETGPAIFKKFFNILKSGKYGNIVHPTEGRDFVIDRQGEGRRTNYDNSLPSPDKEPLSKDRDEMREILTKAVGMKYSELVRFPKKEDLATAVREFLDPESIGKPSDEGMIGSVKETKQEEKSSSASYDSSYDEDEGKTSDTANEDQIDDLLDEFI